MPGDNAAQGNAGMGREVPSEPLTNPGEIVKSVVNLMYFK